MSRVTVALSSTVIILLIVPLIGYINNKIIDVVLSNISRILGRTITLFIANYLTFVGTIHHELSHAIFAFCTGAKIVKIDLFYPSGNTLGKVEFIPRGNKIIKSIQLTASAIAPVIMGCITEYILITYVATNSLSFIATLIVYYLIVSIMMHMTMSKADIKSALKGLPICALLIFCILFATKVNIPALLIK